MAVTLCKRITLRLLLISVIVLCCIFLLPPILNICFPLAAGFIIAWLLHPLIEIIRKRIKISRKILSFVFTVSIVCIAGGILAFFIYSLINQIVSFVSGWLESSGNITDILYSSNILAQLPEEISLMVTELLKQISDWLRDSLSTLLTVMTSGAKNFITSISSFFVSLFVFISATYFISADYVTIRTFIAERFQGSLRIFLGFIRKTIITVLGAYLKAQLMLSSGVFLIILLSFMIIGQRYALLLAFIFAILDFIPIIGAGTVMVPWSVICLLTGNYGMAVKLIIIWVIIVIYRRILEPKIVGSQTGLSPILSLASIYLGMRIGGIAGMVLGPIVLQIIIVICKSGIFNGLINDLKQLIRYLIDFLKESK